MFPKQKSLDNKTIHCTCNYVYEKMERIVKTSFRKKLWCTDEGGVPNEGSVLFAVNGLMNDHGDPKRTGKLGVTCTVSLKCLLRQQALPL